MTNLEKIALRRLSLIVVKDGYEITNSMKLGFLSELTNFGYNIKNHYVYNDSVLSNYSELISTLKEMKGGDVKYVPLFQGFPDNVPEQNEYFVKRLVGFFGNYVGLFDENNGKTLENGMVVPEWLFNLDEFGADPITQFQSEELYNKGLENQNKRLGDSSSILFDLEFVTEKELDKRLKEYLSNLLYSKSSIKESLKDDLTYLIENYGLDFIDSTKVVFKEIRSYVMTKLWVDKELDVLSKYISTPTDLLRMFAQLTDTDISLATPIKFPKFNRIERKFILQSLDSCGNLLEDLNRYKSLWLEIGRYLHPGEYKRYKNTFDAFDVLRNGKVITFNSKVERAISERNLKELMSLLVTKPGIFGRKIHEILEKFGSDSENTLILDGFMSIAHELELKNLLILERYFKSIEDLEYRSIINKKGKIVVLPNRQKEISHKVISKLLEIIEQAIFSKIKVNHIHDEKDKIWVDSELKNYTVPLQQRKMSDGLLSIGRGSRLKLEDNNVLRMFCYWKEKDIRTDLDLSLISFDDEMNYKGQVSYTNLADNGIVHSGDLQSASNGAAEFIDIDLNKIKSGVRYLSIQIYKFCGEDFGNLEISHAGWMMRDKVDRNYKSFDIKTVKNKFDVRGHGKYAIPLIVDLKTREVIFIDMYMNGISNYNTNEGAINDISIVTKELVNMIQTKPNMYDLLMHHVKASNSSIVSDKDESDISYGVNDCTHNIDRVDEILANLL